MPKADRIRANLPPTFRVQAEPSALRALVDAYGGELQLAENTLTAVMRAHWVDHADAGESVINDLAHIGALYGLGPRDDESVEEFREHLVRYVRTFLGGTVTVRGGLRVAAEALHLHVEDDDLDSWWTRGDVLTTMSPRGADAATALLGVAQVVRIGHGPLPAVIEGAADLRAGVDVSERSTLRLALDGGGPVTVDLAATAADPAGATPDEIVAVINETLGLDGFASVQEGRVRLTSVGTGPDAEIRVADSDEDAAGAVLGLPARAFVGADAGRATVTGCQNLSNPVDLTLARFLRISIDGTGLEEVDCAAAATDPASVDVDDVATAINDAFGFVAATHDGRFLTLTSPTPGSSGYVAVLEPAAQSATATVLGAVPSFVFGTDERRAGVLGRDIGFEVDLTAQSRLGLTIDNEPTETVDIAGAEPEHTTPAEIAAAINEGLQMTVAGHDGRRLTLASPTPGAAGRLVVDEVAGDAAEPVLGLRSRIARGRLPSTASLTGDVDLSAGLDLSARHLLVLSVDGSEPVEVELRRGVDDLRTASLGELVDAVNHALGDLEVARSDGAHLILVSPTAGAGGSLAVSAPMSTRRRRFVTRARVSDDAATTLFGFTARRVVGAAATAARVEGEPDLVAGADLRDREWLRVGVDGTVLDVRVAGPRSRATTPVEIVDALNERLGAVVAFTDGHSISVVSPTRGPGSRVEVDPPHSRDALDLLGLQPGLTRGRPATGVRFTGTAELGGGIELPADAALRIGVDAAPAVDMAIGDGTEPADRRLSQIVAAINHALVGPVAAHDGAHLLLASSQTGPGARLDIEVPTAGTDVTASLLGVDPPRRYHGGAATAAVVVGAEDLTTIPAGLTANLLLLSVDGGAPVTVDIASRAADPDAVTVADVAVAVNAASDAQAAVVHDATGTVLSIESPSAGLSSRLELQRTGASDAAPLVFGRTGIVATGSVPVPASLEGEVDLLGPVDLTSNSTVTLVIDDGPGLDVDVGGVRPAATLLAEVTAAINTVRPGIADATADDRLRVTSPTAGAHSAVEVRPQRHLELQEYPPEPAATTADVRHGDVLALRNTGAAPSPATVEITSSVGVSGPRLADPTTGWSIRVLEPLSDRQRLTLEASPSGQVFARIHSGDTGPGTPVRPDRLLVEPADGAAPLVLRRGRNTWSFGECIGVRYDAACFDESSFAGGACREEGIFGVSRFDGPSVTPAVYAGSGTMRPTATVSVAWETHVPGAFVVNLPEHLDPRFGMRFGEGRFGTGSPELHPGVVTDPPDSDDFIEQRINMASRLVTAEQVSAVPIGWSAASLPFRDPVSLTLGGRDQAARLYLSEEGLGGDFIEVKAAGPGAWGNAIALSGRKSGPAIYDIEVHFTGSYFENARRAVEGNPLPALADQLLQPGPVGVLTAKAAGVRAAVTRDRVIATDRTHDQTGQGPAEGGSP